MSRSVIVLVTSFLHNAAFTNGTFFLALYFQVCILYSVQTHVLIEFRIPGRPRHDPAYGWCLQPPLLIGVVFGINASSLVYFELDFQKVTQERSHDRRACDIQSWIR